MSKADNTMAAVVDDLIARIEAGAGDWSMPWTGTFSRLPVNEVTRLTYRGGNIILLWLAAMNRNFSTSRWATYKQWASVGGQVRKGERGTACIKWAKIETANADGTVSDRLIPNAFTVFNMDQVDGYIGDATPIEPVFIPEVFELLVDVLPVRVKEGQPAYSPDLDVVFMPPTSAFTDGDAWAGTFAHELAHWTGHPSRLNREYGKRFGDQAYAAEELVAELSAAFTCADFGIAPARRQDHAAYLQHWITMLKAEPSLLWSVASKAQAATDHLVAYAPSMAEINGV